MGEEGCNFCSAHLSRMPFVVEQDKTPDPVHIRVLGTDGVVFAVQGVTDLIEELFGSWFHLASSGVDKLWLLCYNLWCVR
jgi:hypothetical protein